MTEGGLSHAESSHRVSLISPVGAICLLCVTSARSALVFLPTDRQMAAAPIIVVASWDGKYDKSNIKKDWQLRISVVIKRVIRGDVQPGTIRVKYPVVIVNGYGPIFSKSEAKRDSVWFLYPPTDKDPSSHTLARGRCVEPLKMEPFFMALAREDRDPEIGKLLDSSDADVVVRALRDIVGGFDPWPSQPMAWVLERWADDAYFEHRNQEAVKKWIRRYHDPLTMHAEKVSGLLSSRNARIRAMAAAAYAWLIEVRSLGGLTALQEDPDPQVREVARAVIKKGGRVRLSEYDRERYAEAFGN
jgi:hypothetical protein